MVLNKFVQSALLILAITCPSANGWIVAPGHFKAKDKVDQTLADKGNGDQRQSATGVLDSVDSGVAEPGSAESDSLEMAGERVSDSDLSKKSSVNHSEVIHLNGKKTGALSLNKNNNGTILQSEQKSEQKLGQRLGLQPVQLNKSKGEGEGSPLTDGMSRQKMPAANHNKNSLGDSDSSNNAAGYYRTASDMVDNNPFDALFDGPTPDSESAQFTTVEESVYIEEEVNQQDEQKALDQGLIEAQIDDVLSSAEFLAIERAVELDKAGDKSIKPDSLNKTQLSSAPEELLNQLDASDLMDYVAEDDLWKEQLTIEDEP
jgi:hypothetical protein